jgi:hypothetical protein
MVSAGRGQDNDEALFAACPGWKAWAQQEVERGRAAAQLQPERPRDAALRDRLVKMVSEDQEARKAGTDHNWDTSSSEHLLAVDRQNLASLHEIIAAGGVPTTARVGRDGMKAFWLLVQHADDDVALQEQVLSELKTADGVSAGDIALLTDRVRIHRGRPQLYGSQMKQVGQELLPGPIEDAAHLDERRRAAGLAPMADYLCVMRVMYRVPREK